MTVTHTYNLTLSQSGGTSRVSGTVPEDALSAHGVSCHKVKLTGQLESMQV